MYAIPFINILILITLVTFLLLVCLLVYSLLTKKPLLTRFKMKIIIGVILIVTLFLTYPYLFNFVSKIQCNSGGGDWNPYGQFSVALYRCQIPAKDADKSCTDGSQCSYGICVSQGLENELTQGSCLRYKEFSGMYGNKKEGIARQTIFP